MGASSQKVLDAADRIGGDGNTEGRALQKSEGRPLVA